MQTAYICLIAGRITVVLFISTPVSACLQISMSAGFAQPGLPLFVSNNALTIFVFIP